MKKSASAFIVLILLNVLCTAWALEAPGKKFVDDTRTTQNTIATVLMKTVTIITAQSKKEIKTHSGVVYGNDTDTFIVNKKDTINKVQTSKRNKSIQKSDIHELRIQRINKVLLDLAQILNYL
ncbi:MAG TPA: hypothetical protein PK987_06520 [Ferruginibacter sp.]|nr:hypothetical protein [Ferruginibacter sp.]